MERIILPRTPASAGDTLLIEYELAFHCPDGDLIPAIGSPYQVSTQEGDELKCGERDKQSPNTHIWEPRGSANG
jgi:hypothetical protein